MQSSKSSHAVNLKSYKEFKMAKKKAHGGSRKGAGRKPSNPEGATKTIAASVPESLVERLDEFAENKGWNRSKAITEAIRKLIGRSTKSGKKGNRTQT